MSTTINLRTGSGQQFPGLLWIAHSFQHCRQHSSPFKPFPHKLLEQFSIVVHFPQLSQTKNLTSSPFSGSNTAAASTGYERTIFDRSVMKYGPPGGV